MVEEMLAFRGIEVSHETIRQWGLKFGQEVSVLHGWAGWRKGRPVSMLRIPPSCHTKSMLPAAAIFRGRSGG
jgi:hypothetical protein